MKISFYASKSKEHLSLIEQRLEPLLNELKIEIDDLNPDVIICIGGDGTFLKAVQNNIDRLDDVFFLGVNSGKLGYLYDYQLDDLEEAIRDLDNGALIETYFPLLEGTVTCENGTYEIEAINEIKISSIYKTLDCDVFINNEKLEDFSGNGLIISSSIGSTALNKSLGGPLIANDVDTILLTPIAPINNNLVSSITNPIIFSNSITVTISSGLGDSLISFDNSLIEDQPIKLSVKKSKLRAKVLLKENHSFINSLRRCFIK
jgi:NAD+ kinase